MNAPINISQHIQLRAVTELLPYAKNARTHSDEQVQQIAASMRQFGFTNPVLIDGAGEIIAGHGRCMAAAVLGLAEVPTITLGYLTPEQKRAYILADNKLAMNAGWDEQMLAEEMAAIEADGFDLSLTGFSDKEIDDLLKLVEDEEDESASSDDAAPKLPTVPVAQLGDVWLLGKHRVMCGDSTNVANVEALMGGSKADLWLTDPPYKVAYEGKTADAMTIENDEMNNDDFREFLRQAYFAADTVMNPGAVFYIWHADSEGFNFRGAALDVGWKVRQCLVWVKNHFVIGRQDYHWQHEPCLYGWKGGAAHYWASDRKQVTVIDFDKPQRNGEHPTMKPVGLFEYQISNNTRRGDVVLDSFGGSGTTLIACEKMARVARLMEFDPKYCDVIVKRWQEFTGQIATLESTGLAFDAVAAARGVM